MLATFVIFLREGIEASIIVAILLAYLDKLGQRRHFRDVLGGVGLALLLVAAGGVAAFVTIRTYAGSEVQTIFETVTYLIAAVVLTYMTFWMRRHATTMSSELRGRVDAALSGRDRFGLGVLSFQAVGREGLETMVFTLAIAFSATQRQGIPVGGNRGAGVLLGGLAGLAVSLAIAFVIYHMGRRLNLGPFFAVVGVLLMIFAAGLLADAVENMQELGWITALSHPMWSTAGRLSEDSTLGDILHSFLGYADQPTALQLVVYLLYLAVAIAAFVWLGRSRSRPTRTGAAA